jgi:hypothetical protein
VINRGDCSSVRTIQTVLTEAESPDGPVRISSTSSFCPKGLGAPGRAVPVRANATRSSRGSKRGRVCSEVRRRRSGNSFRDRVKWRPHFRRPPWASLNTAANTFASYFGSITHCARCARSQGAFGCTGSTKCRSLGVRDAGAVFRDLPKVGTPTTDVPPKRFSCEPCSSSLNFSRLVVTSA